MFAGVNDDEGFSLGGGQPKSKLGALFGAAGPSSIMDNDSSDSLMYKAPKPPGKTAAKPDQQPNQPGVSVAMAITAYRLVNNQYQHQGRLGIAILKKLPAKDFKILMYVSKQKPVSTCQISANFVFNVLANNYASFTDDQKQSWSILFEKNEQLLNFAKQICLAKYLSQATPTVVVAQDLSARDSNAGAVETGDSLEVRYTGWILNPGDGNLGSVFDSNHNTEKTFRFKTGKGKVIKGWESGMLGMQKSGKRFIVIPPELAYGPKQIGNKVPANSTLVFEVDLLRVKQAKDTSSVKSAESVESLPQVGAAEPANIAQNSLNVATPPFPGAPGASDANPPPDDATVKGRSASLNDQMNQAIGDSSKTNLVSRMARVGQAMIPVAPGNPPVGVSPGTPTQAPLEATQAVVRLEANPTQHIVSAPQASVSPQQHQPTIPPQTHTMPAYNPAPRPSTPNYYPPQHSMAMTVASQQRQPSSPFQNFYDGGHQQQQTMMTLQAPSQDPAQIYNNYATYRAPQHAHGSPVHGGYDLFPLLMTESRQHGSELRLLQEKVDKMTGLVEEVRKQTDTSSLTSSQTMDPSMIMHNVQRIMKENERLKEQVLERNKQIEAQNEKIGELLQQNQKHVEKSNLILEQRNDSFKESFHQSQTRSLQLEQDKVDLTQKLSDSTSRVSDLTLELSNAKQKEIDLRQKFKELYVKEKERGDEAEEKVQELEASLASAHQSGTSRDADREKLAGDVIKLERVVGELREAKESLEQRLSETEERLVDSEKAKRSLEEKLDSLGRDHEARMQELMRTSEKDSLLSGQLSDKIKLLEEDLEKARNAKDEAGQVEDASRKKLEIASQRFGQLRNAFEDQRNKFNEVNEELEEMAVYKERFDKLRAQATAMKQRYEERMSAMQEKLDERSDNAASSEQLVTEVKKVMNTIFHRLRSKVSPEEEYEGARVVALVLQIIKSTTLDLLKRQSESNIPEEQENKEEEHLNEKDSPDESGEEGSGDPEEDPSSSPNKAPEETIAPPEDELPSSPSEITESQEDVAPKNKADEEEVSSSSEVPDAKPANNPLTEDPPEEDEDEDLKAGAPSSIENPPDAKQADDPEDSLAAIEESSTKDAPPEDLQASAPTPKDAEDLNSKNEDDVLEEDRVEEEPLAGKQVNDGENHDIKVATAVPRSDDETSKSENSAPAAEENAAETKTDAEETEKSEPTMNQIIANAIFNQIQESNDDSKTGDLSRSSSLEEEKTQPPPLFDDDDTDDDDMDWLK